MKPRVALALTAGTAAITLLAACSSSSGGTKSTTSTTPAAAGSSSSAPATAISLAKYTAIPTTLPVSTPLSKKPPTGIKVAFLQNGQTPGQQFSAALKSAVQPLGWTEQDVSFNPTNPASVGSAFQQAVNGGAKVIELQGIDSQLYAKYVPLATAKHIVVIDTVTSGTPVPGVTYVDRSGPEGQVVAQMSVAAILADAQKRHVTPHVLTVASALFTSLLGPTITDISANVKAANCGSCSNEVFTLSPQATVSNAIAAPIVSYLQTHRDINYIFVSIGAFSIGLLSAISQAGLGTNIRLVGSTPLPNQITQLKSGDPQYLGWVATSITVVGWMTIDAAARVIIGDKASMYAELHAPTWLLTKDSGSALVPTPVAPVDFESQYKALWHVS